MAFTGRGREFWERAIREFERSSGTQEAFARSLGVSSAALRHWRKKLGRPSTGRSRGGAAVRLMPVTVTSRSAPEMIEVSAEALVVRFGAGTDPGYIAQLVAALRERR